MNSKNNHAENLKLRYLYDYIIKKDPKEDYKLLKNIGSGTYGDVYKAVHRQTNVMAAVKIVKVDVKDDIKAIAQEIHTLRDCRHQNIVEYFGSYLRKNKLWICMEFCGGFSIQDIYTNIRRPLDENCIAFVTRETLRGLSYMHKQGKIHRDIKGANILLTEDGQVKIADFGVAAQITETISKRCSFIGTPYWMAPEVAAVERKGGYDEKCDIWAVGITAIEYAELQPPMFDLHPMKALHILSMRSYKPPVLQNKHKWSVRFHSFLKVCLNKNEKRRPDADTMLQQEFVNQKQLTVSLTKSLLQLNKNPGHIPLVPNDDDDDDEVDVKTENKPIERIMSTRRGSHHTCIEEIRFKIPEVAPAPICEPEETFTLQTADYFNQVDGTISNVPVSPVAVRNEAAEAFNAYNDNTPEDKASDTKVICDLVNDNQRLRFAHKYMWLTGLSGGSQSSADDPPTPPPKKGVNHQKQAPPLPPLPANKKAIRELYSYVGPTVAKRDNNNNVPRRNSSVDLTEYSLDGTSKDRRYSQIVPSDDSVKYARPPAPTPTSNGELPPPVPLQKPVNNNVTVVSKGTVDTTSSKSSDETTKSQKFLKKSDDKMYRSTDNLYDINRRKVLGVGLPPTPKVPMGACFSLIFEGCPLKVNATATWVHPLRNAQIILFGTNEGIYYLSLDELAEGSLTMLFPRRCLWLYIVKNTMMSLSGQHPQLYNHNLILLFKLRAHNQQINTDKLTKLHRILPRRFIPTTKVADTKGCLMVNVTRNPYSGAKYLCAALSNEILIMEWFNPVSTFMEVRRIGTNSLPRPLLNFDLLIFQSKSLPVICLGVYGSAGAGDGPYQFHLLDLNQAVATSPGSGDNDSETATIDSAPPLGAPLTVVRVVQLEYKTVLIALQDSVVITNLHGVLKSSRSKVSSLQFNFSIQSIVCLNDSILTFHQHGFAGKNFSGQLTQEINDSSSIYRLIGSDKNIVVEKRSVDDPMGDANIYILAGHTDTS